MNPRRVTLSCDSRLDHVELLARAVLHCFERVVLPHHREEERELWPMIHRAKPDPDELARFGQEHGPHAEPMTQLCTPPAQSPQRSRV